MLPVFGSMFVGLVLMDVLRLWFPQNIAYAVGALIGSLSLGISKSIGLSWRRVIIGSLRIAAAVFAVTVVRDLLINWLPQ